MDHSLSEEEIKITELVINLLQEHAERWDLESHPPFRSIPELPQFLKLRNHHLTVYDDRKLNGFLVIADEMRINNTNERFSVKIPISENYLYDNLLKAFKETKKFIQNKEEEIRKDSLRRWSEEVEKLLKID